MQLASLFLLACSPGPGPQDGSAMIGYGVSNVGPVADGGRFTTAWNTFGVEPQVMAFLGVFGREDTWNVGSLAGPLAQGSYPVTLDDAGRAVSVAAGSVTIADPSGVWAQVALGATGVAIDGDGRLIVAADTELLAIDPAGSLVWRVPAGAQVLGQPTVDEDGDLYAHGRTDAGDQLLALDSAGEPRWQAPYAEILYPPVLGVNGDVLLAVFDGDPGAPAGTDFALVAVDPEDGTERWRAPTDGWPASPRVWPNGDVFLQVFGVDGSANGRDHLVALSDRGNERWTRDDEPPYGLLDADGGQAVIDDHDRVWVPCQDEICIIGPGGGVVDRWVLGWPLTGPIGLDEGWAITVVDDNAEGYVWTFELGSDADTANAGWPTLRGNARGQGRAP